MHARRTLLRASAFFLLAAWLVWTPGHAQAPEQVTITLLSTTDLHGNLYPFDYFQNRAANRGLAKVGTLVKQVRAETPHTLLVDCGDTIQGTSLAYYFARKDTSQPNPTIALMNALGFDAMATGNHEFNFGLDVLWRAKRESSFPWLSANIRQDYFPGDDAYFPSHLIKEVAGVRVGIVGFITPGVPNWEQPENYKGYSFESIVAAAKRVIPEVRKQVDLLVVIAHSGLGRNPQTGEGDTAGDVANENQIWDLAEQVPGIDVIFFGHTHRELPEKFIGNVLLAQARNWGQSLARADVTLQRVGNRWEVMRKASRVMPVTDSVPADPQLLAMAEPYHAATQKYLDTPVATLSQPLTGFTGRVEDHPLVDLIHKVQLEYGQADVSMATIFIPNLQFRAGPITVRELAALYLYENTLYVVEMTGAQLKEALEHAASHYPSWPPQQGERIAQPSYQTDVAEGVEYKVDLTQPVGRRIRDLRFRGAALDASRKLRVAINNYRYTGGGNYRVYPGLPVVYRSPQEVRELLIEYVQRTQRIPTTANGNWEIVPPEARRALLDAVTAPPPPRSP